MKKVLPDCAGYRSCSAAMRVYEQGGICLSRREEET